MVLATGIPLVDSIRTTSQLIAALKDVAGAETASWFSAELAR